MGGRISELEPVLEEMKKNGSFEKVKQRALEHLREDTTLKEKIEQVVLQSQAIDTSIRGIEMANIVKGLVEKLQSDAAVRLFEIIASYEEGGIAHDIDAAIMQAVASLGEEQKEDQGMDQQIHT